MILAATQLPPDATSSQVRPSKAALDAELARLHGALVKNYPGFKPRLAQKRMIYATALRLAGLGSNEGERPAVTVEAGTGTGKSLAYLVAAVAVSRLTGQRMVISTATVLLQEQLVERDIPAFLRACELEGAYKVREAKGAGRYLCPQRVDRLLGMGSTLDLFAGGEQDAGERVLSEAARGGVKWATDRVRAGRGGGDLDTLKRVGEDIKPRIGVRLSECLGGQCPDRDVCPMRQARRGLFKSEIIVANHALILSLLASGGVYFAPPKECLYIFDEADTLSAVAERAFAASVSATTLSALAERCTRTGEALDRVVGDSAGRPLSDAGKQLGGASGHLDTALAACGAGRLPALGTLPETMDTLAQFLAPLERIEALVAAAAQAIESKGIRANTPDAIRLRGALGMLTEGARTPGRAYRLLATRREGGEVAAWVEGEGERGLRLHLAPLDVGQWLARHLWRGASGVVLTSATLRTLSSFDSFQRESGIGRDALSLALGSPFDLAASRVLYPRRQALPRSHEHEQLCDRVFTALCTRARERSEGVLVLAASWAGVRRLAALNAGTGLALVQGSTSKSAILKTHRERIACAQGSVILATTSFCAGLDLPGDECRVVMIDKIPFYVPDDPLEASRAEWIEQRGASPFMERALPAACRRLTQAVGRLVRSPTDQGDVVIVDERLSTKRYGRQLLTALGPYTLLGCEDGEGLIGALSRG